jgi:hypothetical protein
MKAHELFAAMSPALANEILEFTHISEKPLYHTSLEAVANLRRVRPVYLERQPRAERHVSMAAALGRPALELAADGLIRNWLIKKHTAMLTDFLDALKITHDKGVVEDIPASVEDTALRNAVDSLFAKHPGEAVAIYLQAFHEMNEGRWPNLSALLDSDPRLVLSQKPPD